MEDVAGGNWAAKKCEVLKRGSEGLKLGHSSSGTDDGGGVIKVAAQ